MPVRPFFHADEPVEGVRTSGHPGALRRVSEESLKTKKPVDSIKADYSRLIWQPYNRLQDRKEATTPFSPPVPTESG
jgi:hypothetical protein